jgi:hypothetical protein
MVEMFKDYKEHFANNGDKTDEIFITIGAKYGKSAGIVKTNIKKQIIKEINENKITLPHAVNTYNFKEADLLKLLPAPIVLPSPAVTLEDLHKILIKIEEKDKRIECLLEIIQKLIISKNPEQLVESIRTKRKEDGTEYVEPIRPIVKSKPIQIIHLDSRTYKVISGFSDKDHIKKVNGARWNASDKHWTIPKDQLDVFEGVLKTANVIYEIQETTIDVEIQDTQDIQDDEVGTPVKPSMFLN